MLDTMVWKPYLDHNLRLLCSLPSVREILATRPPAMPQEHLASHIKLCFKLHSVGFHFFFVYALSPSMQQYLLNYKSLGARVGTLVGLRVGWNVAWCFILVLLMITGLLQGWLGLWARPRQPEWCVPNFDWWIKATTHQVQTHIEMVPRMLRWPSCTAWHAPRQATYTSRRQLWKRQTNTSLTRFTHLSSSFPAKLPCAYLRAICFCSD